MNLQRRCRKGNCPSSNHRTALSWFWTIKSNWLIYVALSSVEYHVHRTKQTHRDLLQWAKGKGASEKEMLENKDMPNASTYGGWVFSFKEGMKAKTFTKESYLIESCNIFKISFIWLNLAWDFMHRDHFFRYTAFENIMLIIIVLRFPKSNLDTTIGAGVCVCVLKMNVYLAIFQIRYIL